MKRILDIIAALVLAPFALVIVVGAALAIRLETRGSPLFWQTRVGRSQRPFRMLKLRTMAVGTASLASHEIGTSAITKVGALLRKTKIDELPQIWSVLGGSMSFVGPRPCLPVQTDLIAAREELGVFEVRPGITGMAQIMGIDMSTPDRLAQVDADYVAKRTMLLDLKILLRTVLGGAYYDAADAGR